MEILERLLFSENERKMALFEAERLLSLFPNSKKKVTNLVGRVRPNELNLYSVIRCGRRNLRR